MHRPIRSAILGCVLSASTLAAQSRAQIIALKSFTPLNAAAGDDTLFARGLQAMVASELTTNRRVQVVDGARAKSASFTVSADVRSNADSVAIVTRISSAAGADVRVDTLAAPANEAPSLAAAVAQIIGGAVTHSRSGGPVFRPPRPPIPRDAVTLYARAVVARSAGDADTAVRFFRQALRIAPRWTEPRRQLAMLNVAP